MERVDVRTNANNQPANVFHPDANRLATVGRPDPTPDDVIMGWLVPYNSVSTELNGLSFRNTQRVENWRRALLPYELRWCSAWMSMSDSLIVLK